MNESEFVGIDIPIFMAHCYTVREKINYIRGMKMYRQTPLAKGSDYDYRETCNKLEIPAYFISGEYDYNCPWPLVEDYVDKLDAPDKGFFLIENSAHSPLWENEAACFRILGTVLFE